MSLATREGVAKASESTTGMVSYLAIYIGFVLVVSCAAILAIQQLSGASDSALRYRTLSELGCPDRLIYRSLLFQTLLSFLFPLIVALAHSVVALKCVIDVIKVFGQINILSSSLMAVSIFLVVYGGYFFVTYRTARSVVHGTLVGARHSA
jgi:putative ABC transport system permease protein